MHFNLIQLMGFLSLLLMSFDITGQGHDLSIYPEAKPGQIRYAIELPPLAEENNFRLEIYAGSDLEIDCNEHFYSGQLAQKKLEGRNYNYYLYEGDGKVFSTLMGCPGVEKRRVFVRTTTVTVPYNSRLPVVIYVPEQLEIRYKIWSRIEREYRAAKN